MSVSVHDKTDKFYVHVPVCLLQTGGGGGGGGRGVQGYGDLYMYLTKIL